MLDGWRAISILAVMVTHLIPIGPDRFAINESLGVFGMAIFFTLSGFLITSTLYFQPSVRSFLIRRFCRIVPAAWLFLLIVLPFAHASLSVWRANLLFYSNIPPFHMVLLAGHLWSLGVEVQFYVGIALLFLTLRDKGLVLLPFLCVAVTLGRIASGTPVSIVTWYRVDEILAGASLAWLFHGPFSGRLQFALSRINPAIPLFLLCAASYPGLPRVEYLRPYFAATLVGTTLFRAGSRWNALLESKFLAYVASISYALYIWHPIMRHGWFDDPSRLVRLSKRPIGIVLGFLIAHLSTFYFERPFIALGKRLTPAPRG